MKIISSELVQILVVFFSFLCVSIVHFLASLMMTEYVCSKGGNNKRINAHIYVTYILVGIMWNVNTYMYMDVFVFLCTGQTTRWQSFDSIVLNEPRRMHLCPDKLASSLAPVSHTFPSTLVLLYHLLYLAAKIEYRLVHDFWIHVFEVKNIWAPVSFMFYFLYIFVHSILTLKFYHLYNNRSYYDIYIVYLLQL